jgi:hypothetical protein
MTKKLAANPTELKCPGCDGTGFFKVMQTTQPDRAMSALRPISEATMRLGVPVRE